jgi:putative membrane protein
VQSITILAAALAALIHLWFFAMESLWFMRESVWRRFGLRSEEEAQIVRSWAWNQGFYNLFLAVGVIAGLALLLAKDFGGAQVLVLFACASMVAAGVVLVTHDRRFARAAALQAVPPLIAVVSIVIWPLLSLLS